MNNKQLYIENRHIKKFRITVLSIKLQKTQLYYTTKNLLYQNYLSNVVSKDKFEKNVT